MKFRLERSAPRPASRAFVGDTSFSSLDSELLQRGGRPSSLLLDSKQQSVSSAISNARRLVIEKNALFEENKLLQIEMVELQAQLRQATDQLRLEAQNAALAEGQLQHLEKELLAKQTLLDEKDLLLARLGTDKDSFELKLRQKDNTISELHIQLHQLKRDGYPGLAREKDSQLLEQAKQELSYQLAKIKEKDQQIK
jgi:hypothetical protein